jgi:hypothetical protein
MRELRDACLLRDILDHSCCAWNKLVEQPWHITSIGLRDWAHQSACMRRTWRAVSSQARASVT